MRSCVRQLAVLAVVVGMSGATVAEPLRKLSVDFGALPSPAVELIVIQRTANQ